MPYRVPLQGQEGGRRTLVLLDDLSRVHDHSIFFANLAQSGHELSYFQSTSQDLKLKKYGVNQYDNIIMLNADELNTITFQNIVDFVDEGGNVLVAVDGVVSEATRSFAESCGIDFDRKGSQVLDHFSFEASADARCVGVLFAVSLITLFTFLKLTPSPPHLPRQPATLGNRRD